MCFHSILFPESDVPTRPETHQAPVFFHDLNLDQIVDAIVAGWKGYDLTSFFYSRLNDLDAIAYRQEVMQDLEDEILMQAVKSFSGQMRAMRARLDQLKKLYYKHAMDRGFVGAVEIYCTAVDRFSRDLWALDVKSRGLRAFRKFLKEYVASVPFRNLQTGAEKLKSDLSSIRYAGVAVKAKRKELLALLRKGLRSNQLVFPAKNGPVEWPEIQLTKKTA